MSDSNRDHERFELETAQITRNVCLLRVGGLLGTAVLLGGAICFSFVQWQNMKAMKPNEWGDFLAGWLGLIGVLWLIVGYFQQGLELRQNTKALELQAKELKEQVKQLENSVKEQEKSVIEQAKLVKQQEELVMRTQEQISLERKRQKWEEELRFQEAQPRIVIDESHIFWEGKTESFRGYQKLWNIGAEVTEVYINSEPQLNFREKNWSRWPNQDHLELRWECPQKLIDIPLSIEISYLDATGKRQSKSFEFIHEKTKTDPDPKAITLIVRHLLVA